MFYGGVEDIKFGLGSLTTETVEVGMNERYCGEHKILIVTVSRRNIEPPGELIGPTLISLHILVNSEELSNQLQKKHHNSNKVFYLVLGGWLSMYLTLSGGV